MASLDLIGTTMPSCPAVNRSSAPVLRLAITGQPAAIASAMTIANPSSMLGSTSTWDSL